jgi:hypothetical protein
MRRLNLVLDDICSSLDVLRHTEKVLLFGDLVRDVVVNPVI